MFYQPRGRICLGEFLQIVKGSLEKIQQRDECGQKEVIAEKIGVLEEIVANLGQRVSGVRPYNALANHLTLIKVVIDENQFLLDDNSAVSNGLNQAIMAIRNIVSERVKVSR